jgi:SAM-dependent methyltransferase
MKICLACEARFDAAGWRCPECGWELGFADDAEVSFPDESFELLAELEERSFWFRARNDLIVWALRAHFPEAASLFEVGCGTGFVLAALRARRPELRLVGGEPARAGAEIARSRVPDVPILQLDARRLPFEREFDVVAAFDVLEHIDDDERVLRELARTARLGLLVTVPQHPRLWSAVDEFSGHVRRYTRRELTGKLERVGLRVVRATSFVSLLLPLVAASRLVRKKSNEPYDPRSEYAMPRIVDRAFEQVMRLERRLIERRVSFPAGTSLLVAARRG